MRKKLLTKRQQLGFFNCADPIALMREYVSFTEAIRDAAHWKKSCPEYKNYPFKKDSDLTEEEKEIRKEIFSNLSREEAFEIEDRIHGHIYKEVLLKMLDTFPKEVSKEILVKYGEHAFLDDEVMFRALNVLGKDAADVIVTRGLIDIRLFNRMLRLFSKVEVKEMIYKMGERDLFGLDDASEVKLLELFPPEETKEIIKFFITKTPGLDGPAYLKMFDIFSKEEIKEILELSIKEDRDIWYETLLKIVDVFPKDEAKKLINDFFETSPGMCSYTWEREKVYKKLNKKK